jgi:hypothetical protein
MPCRSHESKAPDTIKWIERPRADALEEEKIDNGCMGVLEHPSVGAAGESVAFTRLSCGAYFVAPSSFPKFGKSFHSQISH